MDCQLYTDETEESYCVWRTFFSEKQKICTYQVDLFRLRPDGAWERDYEEHRERAWSAAELTELLSAAGLSASASPAISQSERRRTQRIGGLSAAGVPRKKKTAPVRPGA